ncbi:duf636 domain protein [Colletotrichum karsti]|uniref:Duf636 domain protein n=1 Tax=Colletotrichum karsti TaxID=1095194 RepID=A0A9P6HYR5_9PEZI|nr:duf636 domain protein [Colletotrichum karsti]KAF9873792.1 duf636 domain protein [Colletotrichum karsti]
MADPNNIGPKPTTLTGGCLCAKLRYTVTLPATHDFVKSAQTCQCTQCRRQSGALFAAFHDVPPLQWTEGTATLAEFGASESARRGFCTACGSWLYWKSDKQDGVSICLGTLDPEFLVGEEGYGRALASGMGGHHWCGNEIPGVTSDVPMLRRGRRNQGNPPSS